MTTTTTATATAMGVGNDNTTTQQKQQQQLTIDTGDASAALLELAANDDAEGLRALLGRHPTATDEPSPWYSRRHSSPHMSLDLRTPLMVAATFASLDSLRLLLSLSVDVNRPCGLDRSTPVHCAAAGGSPSSPSAVRLLLSSGADPLALDSSGRSPADVAAGPPEVRSAVLGLLGASPATAASEHRPSPSASPRREYPSDPTLPDIKNSIYSTDEFRMYSFKVRPCSRAYSHDWTECPFVHPGENARRRDPRRYHYSCVPCPDFRKGSCRRGDLCEYAHGVFECWLHPAQYRTRLCKDGTSCNRRVCFFAHTHDELRPLYLNLNLSLGPSSSGSPRSTSSSMIMDMATALGMMPVSPSSSWNHHHQQQQQNPNAINANVNTAFQQQQQPPPSLQLSGSRLRSALNARDVAAMDQELAMLQELEHHQQQLLGDISTFSPTPNHGGRLGLNHLKSLASSNLDDLFSNELSLSPRYATTVMEPPPQQQQQQGVYSPSHKPSSVMREFHHQQGVPSPINTNPSFLQSIGSPSPRAVGIEGGPVSPMSARLAAVSQREKLRSLSSRELGAGSLSSPSSFVGGSPVAANPWSKWGQPLSSSSSGRVEWAVDGEELGRLRRSNSFEHTNGGDEPDLSWVQSLVKESPTEVKERNARGLDEDHHGGENGSVGVGGGDHGPLGAWLEQMQL